MISFVGAGVGVVAAALIWQLWRPSDQPPSGSPPAKRYGSPLGPSSDLYRLRGECQRPRELVTHYFYVCQFRGNSLFFIVYTPRLLAKMSGQVRYDPENRFDQFFQPFSQDSHGDLRDLDPGGFRDFACSLGLHGILVGPNWMALSDERITVEATASPQRTRPKDDVEAPAFVHSFLPRYTRLRFGYLRQGEGIHLRHRR